MQLKDYIKTMTLDFIDNLVESLILKRLKYFYRLQLMQ